MSFLASLILVVIVFYGIATLVGLLSELFQQIWFWLLLSSILTLWIALAIQRKRQLKAKKMAEERLLRELALEEERRKQEIKIAEEKRIRAIGISNIDHMEGYEFEEYVKKLLTYRGFHVKTTKASGDLGVDLIAERKEFLIAAQIKRHNKPVSRHAVSDVVGGMRYYGCNKAMVITNSYFSTGAKDLAKSNGCELIDRDALTKWIMDFQSAS